MAAPVDLKLLRQTKFPPEFSQKVDMKKVNIEVMKKWIARKLSEILGNEDDVVIELCFNLLEGARFPDIKALQIQLTGFLDRDTPKFCKELWNLCLSAQQNPQGVPKELLEAKKQELLQEKAEAEKAAEAAAQRTAANPPREVDLDAVRHRERIERAERGRGRGGRGNRTFDARRSPRPRSPSPHRRRSPHRPLPRRETDTYVPGRAERTSRRDGPRDRSLSRSTSPSLSRSPPRQPRRNSATRRRSLTPRKVRHVEARNGNDDRVKSRLKKDDHRRKLRSESVSSGSRSPAPRRHRDRRRSSSSHSSSRDEKRRERRRRDSHSRDRSRDRGQDRTHGRRNRRLSSSPDDHRVSKRTDVVRAKTRRDNPRLSRSPDESNRHRSRSPSRSGSRSRSRSRNRERKRRRSIVRYEPRRRRNTSSPSPSSPEPEPKRQRRESSQSNTSHSTNAE